MQATFSDARLVIKPRECIILSYKYDPTNGHNVIEGVRVIINFKCAMLSIVLKNHLVVSISCKLLLILRCLSRG